MFRYSLIVLAWDRIFYQFLSSANLLPTDAPIFESMMYDKMLTTLNVNSFYAYISASTYK